MRKEFDQGRSFSRVWHGLSRAWFEEGVVGAGCGLSRGRRDIAGHGCEVWAGLGWSRAGVEQGVAVG